MTLCEFWKCKVFYMEPNGSACAGRDARDSDDDEVPLREDLGARRLREPQFTSTPVVGTSRVADQVSPVRTIWNSVSKVVQSMKSIIIKTASPQTKRPAASVDDTSPDERNDTWMLAKRRRLEEFAEDVKYRNSLETPSTSKHSNLTDKFKKTLPFQNLESYLDNGSFATNVRPSTSQRSQSPTKRIPPIKDKSDIHLHSNHNILSIHGRESYKNMPIINVDDSASESTTSKHRDLHKTPFRMRTTSSSSIESPSIWAKSKLHQSSDKTEASEHSVLNTTKESPSKVNTTYYPRPVMYGGTSAYNLNKLYEKTNSKANSSDILSHRAKKILNVLEHYSSPYDVVANVRSKNSSVLNTSKTQSPSYNRQKLYVASRPTLLRVKHRGRLSNQISASLSSTSVEPYQIPSRHISEEDIASPVGLPDAVLSIDPSNLPKFNFGMPKPQPNPEISVPSLQNTQPLPKPITTFVNPSLKKPDTVITNSFPIGRDSIIKSRFQFSKPQLSTDNQCLCNDKSKTANKVNLKITDNWQCADCWVPNKDNIDKCICCGTIRPTNKIVNSDKQVKTFKFTPLPKEDSEHCVCSDKASNPTKSSMESTKTSSSNDEWKCDDCWVHNKGDVNNCVSCGGKKPQQSSNKTEPSKPLSIDSTKDWKCSECWVNNKIDSSKCVCCGANKPQQQIANEIKSKQINNVSPPNINQESWKCTECWVSNKINLDKCVCCGSNKPENSKESNTVSDKLTLGSREQTDWKCNECWVTNKSNADKCVCCGNKKAQTVSENSISIPKKQDSPAPKSNENWNCTDCWVSNKNDVDKCVCCGGKRSQKTSSTTKTTEDSTKSNFSVNVKSKSDDWKCKDCWVTNKVDADKCVCCGSKNPQKHSQIIAKHTNNAFGTSKIKEDWKCPVCLSSNSSNLAKCNCCQSPKPGTVNEIDKDKLHKALNSPVTFKFGINHQKTSNEPEKVAEIVSIFNKDKNETSEKNNNTLPQSSTFKFGVTVAKTTECNTEKVTVDAPKPTFTFGITKPATTSSAPLEPVITPLTTTVASTLSMPPSVIAPSIITASTTPTSIVTPASTIAPASIIATSAETALKVPILTSIQTTANAPVVPSVPVMTFGSKPMAPLSTISESSKEEPQRVPDLLFKAPTSEPHRLFSFGGSSKSITPSSLSTPVFKFSTGDTSKTTAPSVVPIQPAVTTVATTAQPALFTFASAPSTNPLLGNSIVPNNSTAIPAFNTNSAFAPTTTAVPSFGLAAPMTFNATSQLNQPKPAEPAKFNFNFNASKPAFGNTPQTGPFGQSQSNAPVIFGSNPTTTTSTFTFGAPTTSFSMNSNPFTANTQANAFGMPSQTQNPPLFSATSQPQAGNLFGNIQPSNTPTSNMFQAPAAPGSTFGSSAPTVPNASFPSTPAFNFGAQSFNGPPQPGVYNFGASAAGAAPQLHFNMGMGSTSPSIAARKVRKARRSTPR